MRYGKYIIIKNGSFEEVVMFSNTIAHSDFLHSFHKDSIVSAGMFVVGAKPSENDEQDISVDVFGESVTLDIGIRKGVDEKLIKKLLREDYTF